MAAQQPEALRLAAQLKDRFDATVPTSQAAAELRAMVAQLREALGCVVQCDDVGLMQTNATIEQARTAIAAADQWLDDPPTNQCGETCERAKLCATCARGLEHPSPPPQVPNEHGHLLTTAALWDMYIEEPVDHEIGRLLATLIAIESAFTQKCADTWCTSRNAETLETARAAIAAAGGKVSRNTEPER